MYVYVYVFSKCVYTQQSNAPGRDDGVEVILRILVGQKKRVERDGRPHGLGAACGLI